jgi:plasmid stability protein
MSTMIQIRNVPENVHRTMKARAAMAGMSLSDYLLRAIEQIACRPTLEEICARIESLPPVQLSESVADAVRAERDAR